MPLIARAEPADLPAILALQKLAFRSEAERYQDFDLPPLRQTLAELEEEALRALVLKATRSGALVGSVRGELRDGTCRVGRLVVAPERQGQGIGTALMAAIEAAFPEAQRFEIFTGDRALATQALYARLGYREFKRVPTGGPVVLVFMEKLRAP
jgi:GNAT superfamily N-acetyltransferase